MTAEQYLRENIDDHVTIEPWHEKNILPVFLRNMYHFYEMVILGTPCILMEMMDELPGVDVLQKHINRIETITDRQTVLFYKEITRYRRKSLIEKRIPFVIEDGQMYLPFLELDIKKTLQSVEKEVKHFSASAQKAYLYFLYHPNEAVNATRFAQKMDFTLMTASRALKELYHVDLIRYEIGGKTGRSKEYKRIPDPKYFRKGHVYMKSPVRKVVYVKKEPAGSLIAGLDALAALSMLNPPDHPVRAISREQLNEQKIDIIQNRDVIKDTKLVELQVWDYDPGQFSDKKHVELMSLYASLKEENDERTEQALEQVLRDEPWYMD